VAPTAGAIVSTFDDLQGAIFGGALIHIETSDTIAFTTTLVIDGIAVTIRSTMNSTLSGGGAVRLFEVQNGGDLTLVGLTLTRGFVPVGSSPRALCSLAPLYRRPDPPLSDGWAAKTQGGHGGAILVIDSSATIIDSTFTRNSAYWVSSSRLPLIWQSSHIAFVSRACPTAGRAPRYT
jgi:hypothetical protein